ncbi:hypothetical protein ACUXK8_002469, partial [Staphylococcus epidermidis]
PLKPHAPTAKRKLFAALPTLYIHFVHLYRKEVNALMLSA